MQLVKGKVGKGRGKNLPFSGVHRVIPTFAVRLSILSVSLLHSALTSHPSYLAGKGEDLRIKKNPDLYCLNFNSFQVFGVAACYRC